MPHSEPISAMAVAVVTGMGSAVVQAGAVTPPNPFLVPIVSAAVGGIMSFAVLKTTVRVVERDLASASRKLDDMGTRLARIEGRLGVEE